MTTSEDVPDEPDIQDVETSDADVDEPLDDEVDIASEGEGELIDTEDLDDDEVVTDEPDEALIEQVQDDGEEDEPEAVEAEEDEAEEVAHERAMRWYQQRWRDIQTDFVDTPRDAVVNADRLVADIIEQITTALADERNNLAALWSQDDVSTEDLRDAFRSYRTFFERLVAT